MLEEILRRASWKDVLIIFIGAVAVIGIWRGVWNLLDEFLLVNNFIWSQTVSILVGVLVLILISRVGGWK